jgi:hypothetical protein
MTRTCVGLCNRLLTQLEYRLRSGSFCESTLHGKSNPNTTEYAQVDTIFYTCFLFLGMGEGPI